MLLWKCGHTLCPSKETTISVPFVSGDGVYKDAKGYVKVRINKKGSRDMWINYSI